jgi:short subunit dehydrogenase-like uncharacterized protein
MIRAVNTNYIDITGAVLWFQIVDKRLQDGSIQRVE